MSALQQLVHEPVGVTVTGVRIPDLDARQITRLVLLLAEHGVLILPGQDVGDAAFVAFLRRFGELVFTTGESPVEGFADLNVVSNRGRTTPPRSVFHTDSSYLARPPDYTALRAVAIPAHGGETVFTNQYRAFDTLALELQAQLTGRTITHVVTGLDLTEADERSAEHPVFCRHPLSGRTAMYLSTPARCASISGFSLRAGTEIIELIYAHSTRAENTYRHAWSVGDVVMWDNRCVLHRGDHSDVIGDRVLHRGMVRQDRR